MGFTNFELKELMEEIVPQKTLILIGVTLLCITSKVAAQDIDGAFRLSASIPLFNYASSTLEVEESGQELETTMTAFGLLKSGGIGFAYGISQIVTIGCDFDLSYQKEEVEDEEGDELAFGIVPTLEILFLPGNNIRPLIDLGVGIRISEWTTAEQEISEIDFLFGGAIGIRGFISKSFSIDPMIAFAYYTGSGDIDSGGPVIDADTSGFAVGLSVALSGWI